ncbi:MAG: transporter [Candidatus Melainabacteria bacterium]|nr:transporter [Candidatus Melainabacteria bacterium]
MYGYRVLLTLLLALLLPHVAWASSDEPVPAESPSFSIDPNTVSPGEFLIQTGSYMQAWKDNSPRYFNTATALRLGLLKNTEIRLEGNFLSYQKPQRGFGDLRLGSKWNFLNYKRFSITLLPGIWFPSGSRDFRGSGIAPSVGLTMNTPEVLKWQPQITAVATNQRDLDAGRRFTSLWAAISFTRHITKKLDIFVELAEAGASNYKGKLPYLTDIGFTYLLTNDVQLNGDIYRGLWNNDMGWAGWVGLGIRVPTKHLHPHMLAKHTSPQTANVASPQPSNATVNQTKTPAIALTTYSKASLNVSGK